MMSYESVVSFDQRAMKLDRAADAQEIVDRINEHKDCLHTLALSGNTLGIEAGEYIGKALEDHKELKKALWSDMFTGRSKDVIAPALVGLSRGVILSCAQLVELDLRDNAFGPTGVVGVTELIGSRCCHTLKILRMDNEGLGHQGCRLLTEALTKSLDDSETSGRPMRLEIFTAGRNRLENEGMKMLSDVFHRMRSLRELALFQNGIGIHGVDGCEALGRALAVNADLTILNLSDNSLTPKGIRALSEGAFPQLKKLEVLNLSDCILRSKGITSLADCLAEYLPKLKELYLSGNEIRRDAGVSLIMCLQDKKDLAVLDLNCNEFGEDGVEDVRRTLRSYEMERCLRSLSDDEGCGEEDDDEEGNEDDESYDDYDDEEEEDEEDDEEAESNGGSEPNFSFKSATSPKATSLFEGLPICSPGSFTSLFTSPPAGGSTKPASGGLFGDSSGQAKPSLFGTPTPAAAQGPSLFKTPVSRPQGGLFGTTSQAPAQNGGARSGGLFAGAADVGKEIGDLLQNPQSCRTIVPRIASSASLAEEVVKALEKDRSRVESAIECCIECADVENGASVSKALLEAALVTDPVMTTNSALVQLGLIKGEKKVRRKLTPSQGQVFLNCLKDCMVKGRFPRQQAELVSFFLAKGPQRAEAEALRHQHKPEIDQLTQSIQEGLTKLRI